ncbi:MAG: acyl-CoA dehydratase activase [Candidatus Bathyarchaeota archaeon]|nr:acyl-CoA dehydratase activase [Candidatus Bathyarchaeota archaeon]MDH5788557.1 acyl-CoA dehydratase activase [Candidatus Bathyarchaeota archaeon]
MITAGVDVGAKYVKIVILEDGKNVLARANGIVEFDVWKSANDVFEKALLNVGLKREQVGQVVATGMGRKIVHMKPPIDAKEIVPEVIADAKGTYYLIPTVKTVIDVGAEEGRGIKVSENGGVRDFVINERCAAGAGTFIETMARALEVGVENMGPLALKSMNAIPMNAQCCVFAESEVVSLIHSKVSKEDIAKAIHDAIAGRIASMVLRIGVEKDVALIGGVARNPGFLPPLKKELNTEILIPEYPECVGALGAALFASEMEGQK